MMPRRRLSNAKQVLVALPIRGRVMPPVILLKTTLYFVKVAATIVVTMRFNLGFSGIAMIFLGLGNITPAKAGTILLCPNQALQGGGNYGGGTDTVTPFSGTQDGTCGADSGETLSISKDTDYSKLMWNTSSSPSGVSTQPLPPGLTLGSFPGLDALVSLTAVQAVNPYYVLSFADTSDSLGQASAGDQILLIEDQNVAINGIGYTDMGFSPNTTLVDVYDNTTDTYLEPYSITQANPTTLDALLEEDSSLAGNSLNGVWLAIGLAGGCGTPGCSEQLSVDSVEIAPEPGTTTLIITGLGALAARRRRMSRFAYMLAATPPSSGSKKGYGRPVRSTKLRRGSRSAADPSDFGRSASSGVTSEHRTFASRSREAIFDRRRRKGESAILPWVGTRKTCTVSFQDSDGVRHSVEVSGETLYEAAVLAEGVPGT
jgi:hypothetical protein